MRSSAPVARAIAAAVSRARRSGLERTTAGAAAASRSPSTARLLAAGGASAAAARRDGPVPPPHGERERAAQAQNRPVSCLDAQLPLRARGRLHRHPARRQPARRLHGRARSRRGHDAGARARARLLGVGLRAPAARGRDGADPDLHADARASLRGSSDARDGVRARRRRSSSGRSRSRPVAGSSRSSSSATRPGGSSSAG